MDLEWDQRYWNQDDPERDEADVGGAPARGDRVESGVYRFEVWWLVSSGEEPDERLPEPIETDPFLLEP